MFDNIKIGKYTLPQIWKAVVAFASAVIAQEGVIVAIAQSTNVVPASWVHGLVVGFGAVSGLLTFLKENKQPVPPITPPAPKV
jgi:hypothetical protein